MKKRFLVGLKGARGLYIALAADTLAGLGVLEHCILVVDGMLGLKVAGIGRRPMLIQCGADVLISHLVLLRCQQ